MFPSIYNMLAISASWPKNMSLLNTPMSTQDFLLRLEEGSTSLEEVNADGRLFNEYVIGALTWGDDPQIGGDPPAMTLVSSLENDKPEASRIRPHLTRIEICQDCTYSASLIARIIQSRA